MDDDFEAPTFSLGLDLDQIDRNQPQGPPPPVPSGFDSDDGSGGGGRFDLLVDDSEPEAADTEPVSRVFRRLRRRADAACSSAPCGADKSGFVVGDDEDDIEDFSDQEDLGAKGEQSSTQPRAACINPKLSLRAHGSVIVDSGRKLASKRQNQASYVPSISRRETWEDKIKLPKLTVSPLRKFQLVDSDSDDFLDKDDVPIDLLKTSVQSKDAKTVCGRTAPLGKQSVNESSSSSMRKSENKDLWKDFFPLKSFNIATPVLDEVCEEYFQTLKEKKDGKYPECWGPIRSQLYEDFADHNITDRSVHSSLPPAHRYFFHSDQRIQRLVCNRLHNFHPLELFDNRRDDQLRAPGIDYRSQFSQGQASMSKNQPKKNNQVARGSTKRSRTSKKAMAEEDSQVSGSWVNPRVSARNPSSVGKKRVRAGRDMDGGDPQSTSCPGRWFTDSNGKKVYVGKNGQELTGRMAYRHYKKESGAFKKSRKKPPAKKK